MGHNRKGNMTRYFYDCPIKAAYMSKEFGVKFDLFDEHTSDAGKVTLCGNNEKIYVAPESESLFEEKEGDLTIYPSEVSDAEIMFGGMHLLGVGQKEPFPKPESIIIMRDGKHFFSPLQETSN